jgi:hypothetical protein
MFAYLMIRTRLAQIRWKVEMVLNISESCHATASMMVYKIDGLMERKYAEIIVACLPRSCILNLTFTLLF